MTDIRLITVSLLFLFTPFLSFLFQQWEDEGLDR